MNWIQRKINEGGIDAEVINNTLANIGRPGVEDKLADRVRKMLTDYVPEGQEDAEQFALWLTLADIKAGRVAHIGIFDLEDFYWRDAFDNGDSPNSALKEALLNDDTFRHLFDN